MQNWNIPFSRSKADKYLPQLLLMLLALICGFSHLDAQTTYDGTELSPGDVFLSYGNHGHADASNNKTEAYVAFVSFVDLLPGTQIAISPKLAWKSQGNELGWNGGKEDGTIIWTAPEGGVSAGSEVVLFDVKDQNAAGLAYTHASGNPVVRDGSNSNLTMTGGVQCGTFTHTTNKREDFHKEHMWVFQPGSAGIDDNPRHLSCTGDELDKDNNIGDGTLLFDASETANLSPLFCLENSLFSKKSWRYFGSQSLGSVMLDGGANQMSTSSLNQIACTVFCLSSNFEYVHDDDQLNFDPIGNFALDDDYAWSSVASSDTDGDETLDITLNEEVALVVDVTDVVETRNITLNKGTFQSCDGNARTVAASGDITLGATGMFNGGQGTLEFNGMSDQILDAGDYDTPGSEKVQLKKVKIKKGKKVKFKGHVKLKPGGALEFDDDANVSGDKLEIDSSVSSSLVFQSTGDGTAAIGECSVSNFNDGSSQEFTFQRYIPADPNGSTWVNIGAYVTGTTVADWTSANSNMLIFKYEESNYGSLGSGWTFLWDGTTSLSPGSGYMAMLPAGEDALISVTGAFQIGDVNVDLTFTDDPNQSNTDVDGWNLVSNPYPAPVNLAQVLSGTGISTWYIFDNVTTDGYVAGGSDAPSTLGVGQSFWVKVSTNTTLTFTEADKIISDNNTFVRDLTDDYQGTVGIEIANGGYSKARAFVKFQEGTSEAFDAEHDALMFNTTGSNELRVWMASESGEKLSRQAAGRLEEAVSVPLTVTTGSGGTLVFTEFPHPEQPENLCVTVLDTETGEMAQMGVDSLVVEGLPGNTLLDDRFVLHFNGTPSMTWVSSTCDGLIIDVEGANWETWNVSWEAEDGSQSGEGLPYELEDGAYTFVYDSPESGCMQDVAVTIQTACLGDFNLNGERDVVDLLFILSGLPGGLLESDYAEQADCDCDGLVTINDMLTFLTVFAMDCE